MLNWRSDFASPRSTSMEDVNRTPQYEVAVVGFGPAGAVAACWLGQAGIRTLVLDKSRRIWNIPRAVALDHEILRIFQNLGVVGKILPFTAPFGASEHFGVEGQLIRRIDVVRPPYPMGYLPTMVFSQPPVEKLLREHAAEYATVEVRLGEEVITLQQLHDQVSLELQSDDGTQSVVTTRYLIGCDGASSCIRQCLNIQLNDLGFDEPWMVVDVLVDEASIASLPGTAAQYCNPARPVTYIIGPGNHRRWEIMLLPGEEPAAMEHEQKVWELLSPWLKPGQGKLWRASCYRFHALVAHQWRKGNVFLAGDAAHQQPPFIGQGMCQGIRDVTNLAWKLKAVLRERASDALLETYAEERSRHVYTLTSRIKEIGRHICERDPEAARSRDASLLKQGGGSAPTVTRQEIVPGLEAGLLGRCDGNAIGTLFPQPRIISPEGSTLLDDIVGPGWRLFLDGRQVGTSDLDEALITPVVIGGQRLAERDGVVANWFDRHQCVAALVRPDHYVYAVLKSLDELRPVLRDLSDQLRGS
jgi:3-(3-hydroxy-phenyl)propionate hydroxylase